MLPQRGGEDAVKMAAHGVFLLINPGGGVRAWEGGGAGKKTKSKQAGIAVQLTPITVCAEDCFYFGAHTHTYAKLIAQEVEETISLKSPAASTHCLRRGGKWKPDV